MDRIPTVHSGVSLTERIGSCFSQATRRPIIACAGTVSLLSFFALVLIQPTEDKHNLFTAGLGLTGSALLLLACFMSPENPEARPLIP